MDKNIPLSELIRRGSKVSAKCTGKLSINDNGQLYTCAIGAAYLARFGEPDFTSNSRDALEKCGIDPEMKVRVPLPSEHLVKVFGIGFKTYLWMAIVRLNDADHWSREQIATWLEQQGL